MDEDGNPLDEAALLFDGRAERDSQWEPARTAPTIGAILQLAEPFDLTRAEAVNSFSEESYRGISTRRLRLEHGPSPKGPWKRLAERTLRRGTQRQPIPLARNQATRYLRVTLLENYGEESWWGLAELSVYGRRSQPRPVDFTGAWSTPRGELALSQQGERVTGCFGTGKGDGATLEATVEGPVLFGTYVERTAGTEEPQGRGSLALTLTAEGELSGVWAHDVDGKERLDRWDAKRLPEATLVCERPEKDVGAELEKSGRVVLRGILFEPGGDVLRPESEPVLRELAQAMKQNAERRYRIEGHTDDRGSASKNVELSTLRAARVKAWLVEAGVDAARLEAQGLGPEKPARPNDSEAGRAANRRFEVSVAP
ncbi:OmpA family protein [Myxococcaceae bacterium GXIMD 01537]